MINAAAENQEACCEPTVYLERQTKSDGCPIQDPMLMEGLLGFCDPGHFGGGDDFYNTNYYFFPLLVSERLCGLLTWGERFCAATAYRGFAIRVCTGGTKRKTREFNVVHGILNVPPFPFFSPHYGVFPSGVISSFRPYPPSSRDQASCGGDGPISFRELLVGPFASPIVRPLDGDQSMLSPCFQLARMNLSPRPVRWCKVLCRPVSAQETQVNEQHLLIITNSQMQTSDHS